MKQNAMAVIADNTIVFRGGYFLKNMLGNHPRRGVPHGFLRKITECRQLNVKTVKIDKPYKPPAVNIRKDPAAGCVSDEIVFVYPAHAMYFSPGAFLSVYLSLGNAVLSISQKDATKVACSVVIFASVTVRRNDCIRL